MIFLMLSMRRIFAAMRALHDKRSPIDILTLSEQLKNADQLDSVGGASYLTELTNFVPTAAHLRTIRPNSSRQSH
jgi:replicative DNA helicase